MTYLDTTTNTAYFAVALLTNAEDPSKPSLVVSPAELLKEERFVPLDPEWEAGLRGIQVADTSPVQ